MHPLASPIASVNVERAHIQPFTAALSRHGLELTRQRTTTLQINVGLRCNQSCRHCHLEAGPTRKEMMSPETLDAVMAYARRGRFQVIDITGGAPELHPNLPEMIEGFFPLAAGLMLRCNLTEMDGQGRDVLIARCAGLGVVLVASLPSLNKAQAESQRGRGMFDRSIGVLQRLNAAGYGQPGSGLELNLVSNPTGAFLPVSQAQAEERFRKELKRRWGVVFNRLFTFGNVPLGRFLRWLVETGNYPRYMQRLTAGFNPCTVDGVMCRTLISVSWDGCLYDCDFNIATGLYHGGRRIHVSQMAGPPEPGAPISVSDHCYACTAGAGFT